MTSFRGSGHQVLSIAFCLGLLTISQSWGWLAGNAGEAPPRQPPSAKYELPVPVAFQEIVEVTLLPKAEAHLLEGAANLRSPDDGSQLLVQNSTPGQSSRAFLRFELTGPATQITSAKLELYPVSVWSTGVFVNQLSLAQNSVWRQDAIAPNSIPVSTTVLDSWSPTPGKPVIIDVTPQVQSAILAGTDLTFMVYSPPDSGLFGSAYYGSRQSDANVRPRLRINTVQKLYRQAPSTKVWNSLHWNDGIARSITRNGDGQDPKGWSQQRGIGSIEVDGNGILSMQGREPRIYLNGLPAQFWKNVEITVYYKRIKDDEIPWAGLVIGARSGPEGHTELEPCTSTTYYGRLRHDGAVDFYKELKFPQGESRVRAAAWGGDVLPYDRWIGVKLIVYNTQDDAAVKLELYRDLTEGVRGGNWEKLAEYTDVGGWGNADDCPYAKDHIITQGGGTVFVRNSGVGEAQYKWLSVREIIPPRN